jgi:hypothetical protein
MLERVQEFRPAAAHFEEHGVYTKHPFNDLPSSGYMKFWEEEKRRSIEGYDLGFDKISGYYYFYLNYCQIPVVEAIEDIKEDERVQGDRPMLFPKVWDGDYKYFNYLEDAEKNGKHGVVLKARGRGFSYKGANMLCRNYFLIRGSKSYAMAFEKEHLTSDGLLTKAWDNIDFINEHTAWTKRSSTNKEMRRKASFTELEDGQSIEKGYKSEIIGVSLKDNPNRSRGKRGKLILFEEAGLFPKLLTAWGITRSSMEQGPITFGLQVAFGCVCAGTKVWNNRGDLVKIEDLKPRQGILGYNKEEGRISKEEVTHWNPPAKKLCYRITTHTGRVLECSEDHPILWSKLWHGSQPRKPKGNIRRPFIKKTEFVEAKNIKASDQIAVIDVVPISRRKELPDARLLGWLIGDGSYGINKTPILSNCEGEINTAIDSNYDTVIEKQYITKTGKIYRETRIRGICPKLRAVGIYGQTKLSKTLPRNIHSYSKKSICELLGGLFDTDGYVEKKRGRISITSMSFTLLDEIRFLLQRIGVHGAIQRIKKSEKNPKDKNDHFRFEIADKRSVLAFVKNIKLFPAEKQRRLNTFKEMYRDKKEGISANVHGLRLERVISVEEIGMRDIYNLTAGTTSTYIANGIITHNTGGTEGSNFDGLEELFYYPKAYNIHHTPNIWDDGKGDTECGYFGPEYLNMEGYYDENGNSNIEAAIEREMKERKLIADNAKDRNAVVRYVAEKPFSPSEAVLRTEGMIFAVAELKQHLGYLESNERIRNADFIGDLVTDNLGDIVWKENTDLVPIIDFPMRAGQDATGCIVIFNHPYHDESGRPPRGMYAASADPYDHDKSSTGSLGSTFVYDRVNHKIVAEYSGRPETSKIYYENVRKLLLYYNCQILYENERKGLFDYFDSQNCTYLLLDQPVEIIQDVIDDSKVSRKKGIHMTTGLKEFGEEMVKTWLIEKREDDELLLNLQKIRSIPFLKELIAYTEDGNYDRVMSFLVLMYYLAQIRKQRVIKQENVRTVLDDPFFKSDPFGKKEQRPQPDWFQ